MKKTHGSANAKESVKTSKSKPKSQAEIPSEKVSTEIMGVHARETDEEKNTQQYERDVAKAVTGLRKLEGSASDNADKAGKIIYPLIEKMRGGKYGKAPNGKDYYRRLADAPGIPYGSKQIRRICARWEYILKLKAKGLQHPRLGVALYDATSCVRDEEKRWSVLERAESEGLNVADTNRIARESQGLPPLKESEPTPFKARLKTSIARSTKVLAELKEKIECHEYVLDKEEIHSLNELADTVNPILNQMSEAA